MYNGGYYAAEVTEQRQITCYNEAHNRHIGYFQYFS